MNIFNTCRPWSFSIQKNIANSYAKFDYIFSIDADEELSEILKQSIIFAKNNTEFAAYNLNRLNNYIGKWIHYGIWNPDKKLRLWNKNDAKWSGLIHESVVFNKQVKVGFLKGELLHYSYYSIDQHIKQTDKFTSLSAQEMFSRKKKVNNSKIFFSTFFTFFKGFFIKLAFLDGYYGIIICLIVSFSTFIKYVKLKELYKKENLIKSI